MTKTLRIGFMGTPDFARIALEAIAQSGHEIVCVYSQPPRPKGRGHKTIPSPVHSFAADHNIAVFTPINFKDQADIDAFKAHNLDIAIVAAYGLILPQSILDAPKYGCVNIHGSLLPRWRGAAPIQRAIWAGDEESGICLMQMEAGLDTGPVIASQSCPITPQTTANDLHDTLASMGAQMTAELLETLADTGTMPQATPQDDAQSTYAKMLHKNHGQINWQHTAGEIDRQVRALNPWPGTWATIKDDRIKIIAAAPAAENAAAPQNLEIGTILDKQGHILCGNDTILHLKQVQPAGKKAMDFTAALNGGYLAVGDRLS
ncbi:MAG: methionyl-tRNA formyltransferase [Alphaproteobacteria bacterium]|nr:methionyl-tRNA formyltransferase [Alphaproteobacteria bacterium]|tara:strand:- start:3894 stop:4847 length:954 start_codon:yes stop_codon:yes gene_type:complete